MFNLIKGLLLENLGIKVHFLTTSDLATGDLRRYNVILLGVRTYAVREDLRALLVRQEVHERHALGVEGGDVTRIGIIAQLHQIPQVQ